MRELSELELEMVDGGLSVAETAVASGLVGGAALGTATMSSDVKK